jgi:hypothetical protein
MTTLNNAGKRRVETVVTVSRLGRLPAAHSARHAGGRSSVVGAQSTPRSKIAAYCSLLQLLRRVRPPSRYKRHNRQRVLERADGGVFAPRSMRSFVLSRPGDSRGALAHEPGCPIGFSNVASTIIGTRSPAREIGRVAAPAERGTCSGFCAHFNVCGKYARALSSCQIARRANLT